MSLLSYVWNIRDRTGEDYQWLPKQVKLVNAHETPMTFPGVWGPKDTFQYVTTRDDPERKGGLSATLRPDALAPTGVRDLLAGRAGGT